MSLYRSRFVSTRALVAGLTVTATVAVSAVGFAGRPAAVQAYPSYAQKEAVHCAYCHVNAAGGGRRNYRGRFYKKNDLSFAGFDDQAEATAAGEPLGPEPDPKPASWTAPGAAAAAPAAVTPAPAASPEAPKPTIADLKAAVAKTAAALKADPKSVPAKKAHAASITALAHGVMTDTTRTPQERYPEALHLLRQAVVLDPTNKDAVTTKKTIEDVYKQMGKPLPK